MVGGVKGGHEKVDEWSSEFFGDGQSLLNWNLIKKIKLSELISEETN